MVSKVSRSLLAVSLVGVALVATADHSPQHERQSLMEGVREAAKPLGGMLRGKVDYNPVVVMESLQTWQAAAQQFGELFPEGTETGEETEAAPAIWSDREGFDAALAGWLAATNAAIEAAPQTLDEAKPVIGKAFGSCKKCHDDYRIEKE